METFGPAKKMVGHPEFRQDRKRALLLLQDEFDSGSIDPPVRTLIRVFCKIPYCFTIQCCYGHFVHAMEPDDHNLSPPGLYKGKIRKVKYRIAYLAICIENSRQGRELLGDLQQLVGIDPEYVQFGSAGWFWDRMKNSYAVQAGPSRFRNYDTAEIGLDEAIHVDLVRNRLFTELDRIAGIHREDGA